MRDYYKHCVWCESIYDDDFGNKVQSISKYLKGNDKDIIKFCKTFDLNPRDNICPDCFEDCLDELPKRFKREYSIRNTLNESTENKEKLFERILNEIDTYVDPRSKISGWKVKVLDVYPDEFGGSTSAKVELFDPDGDSMGEENIFIHRQDVKIGRTYDAYIDGIMCSPRIKGVNNIPYSEVPNMKNVSRDRYIE